MKAIRVQGRVVIEIDEIMDVEDDLKGVALIKECHKLCKDLAKEYVYDAPVEIDLISDADFELEES